MEIVKIKNSEPKVLTCIVTYNRPELTKLTIQSYLNTVEKNHYLVVVDNNSNEETKKYLKKEKRIDRLVELSGNYYPGFSCNYGWVVGLKEYPEATLLHRSDNDIFYRFGWYKYCVILFNLFPKLGEFGLLDASERYFFGTIPNVTYENSSYKYNRLLEHDVGGSYIIRRELWDKGIKHIEMPWDTTDTTTEDRHMRLAVEKE